VKTTKRRVSLTTWTPAELAIADYLLGWALPKIRNARKVDAFVKRRQDITHELDRRAQVFVDAWLNGRPLPRAERGFRIHGLTKILRKIIDRSPF